MFFTTQNSQYELDQDGKRIRRLSGKNDPTPNQGQDGVWQEYAEVLPYMGGLRILWPSGYSTITSTILDWDDPNSSD